MLRWFNSGLPDRQIIHPWQISHQLGWELLPPRDWQIDLPIRIIGE